MKIVNMTSKYLWIFLIFMSCAIFSQEQNYIPYRQGKVWGLCDTYKFITVQPQYNSISWYDESVKGFHAEQNGKFGIIGPNSTVIMPFISDKPIDVKYDKFLVFDGWSYYYYSMKTKMRLEEYIQSERYSIYPISDRGWRMIEPFYRGDIKETVLSWDDFSDEDIEMLKPFDNDQYELNFKRNFIEIVSANSDIGIYIPELKKIFLNTPDLVHIGWQYYKGIPYIFTVNASSLKGLVDVNSKEIYPNKYHEIALVDAYHLVYLSESDPNHQNNLIFRTILPNNKVLDGKFEPAVQLWKNGNPFQLYYTIINGGEKLCRRRWRPLL